ncbi:ABC transporter permease [Desulfovibrio sulfodismutans]|uniref:ABC transporter permease n=1 Tax=Desulfolutivibrio sulfodismutans TaxID=63561 RepID=A0A7K3NHX7_9BACT|nr:ABC transporter permease [Desulfolutivibrio sulfodismutans]NDY55385.1 ABC transporter permease [Desulfolutivibrio sulfodismutans]QLA12239.1 ABC transporter permease [Desulfolutivibrio sulfodismutans DSM 3696]
MTYYALIGAVEQGFVYGLMVLGVYLTFRVLDFPDLTVDGSLPLGAAVSAVAVSAGVDPYLTLVLAFAAGFAAGAITGILNTKLGILHLLSSILTMIALYSVIIRIMGRPNLTLLGKPTVLDAVTGLGLPAHAAGPLLYGALAVAVGAALTWYLATRFGQATLATGDNPRMITALGVNTHTTIIAGVGLANALTAVSGALVAQNQGAADVNMGVGTIVAGLASVIIGETLVGGGKGGVGRAIVAALAGSVAYRLAIALALDLRIGQLSVTPSDLNLITALVVVLALTAPKMRAKITGRRC